MFEISKGKVYDMEFRPCIDIHNGNVKQIVGGSLSDLGNHATENFVSEKDASYYATYYKERGIVGGHIILLNNESSEYFEATKKQALSALRAYPYGMQIGGGIRPDNATEYLSNGASHVIVTSYVFKDGKIQYDRLKEMQNAVGKEHLVLDVSCKKVDDTYYVVTDRWQKVTSEEVNESLLDKLKGYCDEILIHAVDVEGKSNGIEKDIATMLGQWNGIPVTYAGGVHSYDDIYLLKKLGKNRLNVTVGSALDLFGGPLRFERIHNICKNNE